MVVKDATIFHDRLENKLEEVPHALSSSLLVVDKLTETCETLVRALSSKVIQSRQDWLLKHLFELGVHFWEFARDRL